MTMDFPYDDMIASSGEPFVLTGNIDGQSASLRGMYDRRYLNAEIGGADAGVPDFLIGVRASALPNWANRHQRVDIRGDTLEVHRLEPDGQGLIYLVCRPAT